MPGRREDDRTSGAVSRRWWWWWRGGDATSITVNPTSTRYEDRPSDGAALADGLSAALGYAVSISDAASLSEALSVSVVQGVQGTVVEARVADSLQPSEAARVLWRREARLSEAVILRESLATLIGRIARLDDHAAIADALQTEIEGLLTHQLADAAGLLDMLASQAASRAAFADQLDLADRIDDVERQRDLVGVSDGIALSFRLVELPPPERLAPSEQLHLVIYRPQSYQGTLGDGLRAREAIATTATDRVSHADRIATAEALSVSIASAPRRIVVGLSDSGTLAESARETSLDSEALADAVLPVDALQTSQRIGPRTESVSLGDAIGSETTIFGLDALPPGDDELLRFIAYPATDVATPPNEIFSSGHPTAPDHGRVIGDLEYPSGSATVRLWRLRWLDSGRVVFNGTSPFAERWLDSGAPSHEVWMLDVFGRRLRIPTSEYSGSASGFIRFDLPNAADSTEWRFRTGLTAGRGVLVVVAQAGSIRFPAGAGDRLTVLQDYPERLGDDLGGSEALLAALDDEAQLRDDLGASDLLAPAWRRVERLGDAASPADTIASHEVHMGRRLQSSLSDDLGAADSAVAAAIDQQNLADAAAPREILHTALVLPPATHWQSSLSDDLAPAEASSSSSRDVQALTDALAAAEGLASVDVLHGRLYHHTLADDPSLAESLSARIAGGAGRALDTAPLNARALN